MTFDAIMRMILNSCYGRFATYKGLEEKILDCATQIYIAEMREKNNAKISENME